MSTNLVRPPGIHDPRENVADKAEKKIRKLLGNTPAAKLLGKIVKISIRNTPT
ncbi:MAG: hypothetical protein GXY07_14715 [Candidatus Hydrogenedentes bacterium]|nr:hypothetical protein [Candidatus Hydrogenedentota bacterium]